MASDEHWTKVQHSTPALVHWIHSSASSFQQLTILLIDQLLELLGTLHARCLDRSCSAVDGSEKRRNPVDFEIGEHSVLHFVELANLEIGARSALHKAGFDSDSDQTQRTPGSSVYTAAFERRVHWPRGRPCPQGQSQPRFQFPPALLPRSLMSNRTFINSYF